MSTRVLNLTLPLLLAGALNLGLAQQAKSRMPRVMVTQGNTTQELKLEKTQLAETFQISEDAEKTMQKRRRNFLSGASQP